MKRPVASACHLGDINVAPSTSYGHLLWPSLWLGQPLHPRELDRWMPKMTGLGKGTPLTKKPFWKVSTLIPKHPHFAPEKWCLGRPCSFFGVSAFFLGNMYEYLSFGKDIYVKFLQFVKGWHFDNPRLTMRWDPLPHSRRTWSSKATKVVPSQHAWSWYKVGATTSF